MLGAIAGAPRVVVAPGVSLRGGRLEFGSKGVLLTRDNTVEDIAEHGNGVVKCGLPLRGPER